MLVKRRAIARAIQWKGWPNRITGLETHPIYPQLASFHGQDVYKNYWIVNENGSYKVWSDDDFERVFVRV